MTPPFGTRSNRREKGDTTPEGRKVIGKKGLGKLSYFGIADTIEVTTVKDGLKNTFSMNLDSIHAADGDYHPDILCFDEPTADLHGTVITLKGIKRKSSFSAEALAAALSKIFYFGAELQINVYHNQDNPIVVTKELRLQNVTQEFKWTIPDAAPSDSIEFFKEKQIIGTIITGGKPLPPDLRGITLYSRGKLVNSPSCFVSNNSSHFYSYLTGCIDVSFIDELETDLVSTNRQSLNWDEPEAEELRKHLEATVRHIEREWREKRRDAKQEELQTSSQIDLDNWARTNPGTEGEAIVKIVHSLLESDEIPTDKTRNVVEQLHAVFPEYAKYHWRHLHPEVQAASKQYYENQDYYHAFLESVKRYVAAVKEKSKDSAEKELKILSNAFKEESPRLLLTESFLKSNGEQFSQETKNNVTYGTWGLSTGLWRGCRNPVSHEEIPELRDSGLFSEEDCLDALSILSHLFRRLDNAVPAKDV